MKPKFQSAYQKMYLVTPGVYEKLKICIEENEKRATEKLNFPLPTVQEIKTPSEKILQQISSRDIGIQTQPETGELSTQTVNPQTGEISTQTINPQTGEIGTQVYPIMSTIGTETETIPSEPISTQTEPVNVAIPISTQTDIPLPTSPEPQQVYVNPLRQPCPQETEQGRIIPSILHQPRNKRISKILQKKYISKDQLKAALQQIPHPLLPKQLTYQLPQQQLKQITYQQPQKELTYQQYPPQAAIEFHPDPSFQTIPLAQQDIRTIKKTHFLQPRGLTQQNPNIKILKTTSFPCNICGHIFTRKYDLNRHLLSRTVHKNLQSKLLPQKTKQRLVNLLPPGETSNLPPEAFDFWEDDPQPLVGNPIVKTKPKLLMPQIMGKNKPKLIIPQVMQTKSVKRTAREAKLAHIGNPRKARPPGGDDPNFDKWK